MLGGEDLIEALRDIGTYSFREKGINTANNLIEILLHEVNKGGNYAKVYTINFEDTEEGIRFKDVSIEDWDKNKTLKYLYREKGQKGAHYMPTARIAGNKEADVRRAFENRVEQWFDRFKKKHSYWLNNRTFIKNLYDAFIKDKDRIKNDLVKLRMQYDDGGFITLVFYQDGEKKYLGDIPDCIEYLQEFSKEKYNEVSNDGVCCLCKNKTRVFGNASPITFYTLDKPGYIAGGMRKENGYKNFPLCFECLLQLNEGAAYMQELLRFKFAGLRYYLIPQAIYSKNEVLDEIMNVYRNFQQEAEGRVSFSQTERIAADEDDILVFLKDVDDRVLLKFLFFQKPSNKFIILMLMEDILPSRIRSLFDAKQRVEDHFIFKDQKFSAKLIQDVKFNFGVLRKLFPTTKGFLEIVNKSFKDRKIDKQYILELIMHWLRGLFNDSSNMKIEVLQAFICLLFLNELGVLKNTRGDLGLMDKCNEFIAAADLDTRIDQFFEEFKSAIDNSAKKAVFLTGVLTQHLLSIQQRDRGSTPFRSQLKGLKLKETDVKALLPKIQQKLEEYKKNYYVQLEKIASLYYLQAGENWGMSVDEINFYFVLGMNLNDATNKEGIPYFKVKGDEINE
jgi:CRISPR-associated protein Csh1